MKPSGIGGKSFGNCVPYIFFSYLRVLNLRKILQTANAADFFQDILIQLKLSFQIIFLTKRTLLTIIPYQSKSGID